MAKILHQNMLESLFDSLIYDGRVVINNAAQTTNLRHPVVSGNMQDAYGAAVYYNGKIVRRAYYNNSPISKGIHKGWNKRGYESDTGRGYLDKFFESYEPESTLCLVCVNAVYYTAILEDGTQGRPQVDISTKYHIISQTMTDMVDLRKKYRGSKLGRITYWDER